MYPCEPTMYTCEPLCVEKGIYDVEFVAAAELQ